METNKLSVECLLGSDGFIPLGKNKIEQKDSKKNIYKMLHDENPIKKLKEFGMFNDKDDVKYKKLEYTGIYNIDEKKNHAMYLVSRTFVAQKNIENGIVVITHKDIDFNCPLYYLSITDEQNNDIDGSLTMTFYDPRCNLHVTFKNKYIKDDQQCFYNIWGGNKVKIYEKMIKSEIHDRQYIFNSHTDMLEIKFDNTIKTKKVNITCKVYDIFKYGGFFNSGWI